MYKGLKKKYNREEYIKSILIEEEDKCYFCLHNLRNYNIRFTNKMDIAAKKYFGTLCTKCVNNMGITLYWHEDNFKTLYDWEE